MATVRCEEIANERYSDFTQNEVLIFCSLIYGYSFIDDLNFLVALLTNAICIIKYTGMASARGGLTIWPCCWVWEEAQFYS